MIYGVEQYMGLKTAHHIASTVREMCVGLQNIYMYIIIHSYI